MRLHLRPDGFVDWPATLACLAVAGAIAFCSHIIARELSVAVWKGALGLIAITVAIGAGSPPARASSVQIFWQGIWLRSISTDPDPESVPGNGEPH